MDPKTRKAPSGNNNGDVYGISISCFAILAYFCWFPQVAVYAILLFS